MGRYTTFSDQDANGAALRDELPAPAAPVPSPASDAKDHKDPGRLQINRVENVAGSTAGAGSGEFHTYRASRRREMERVALMEQRYKDSKAQQEFETKRKRNADEFEANMHKRAEKRRRRKERAKAKAMDAEQKEETSAHKKEQVPETPGGVPEIPNDGSFLARMLALQKEK
ncbi:hypothetical protein PRIC1_009288 [Phytophthora ramorum]|uniref:Uncharacterized protein n=1 Tax=Phytophthora ramorum TaxID=164328 RepID=H3HBP6_PHYRM|nr:PRKR-interacting protein 1-like protein [Phytophthora ramorum]KAH7504854.1 PRKR-interacting protein 1-like protein [Phytophthora ramorum]